MLLNFIPFIGNNEAGDIFCKCAGGVLFAEPVFKSWFLALPSYRPQVAMATAHILKIAECESLGRPFPAGDTKDTVDLRGRVGGFPTDWTQNYLVFPI